jgi:hypothetical protein
MIGITANAVVIKFTYIKKKTPQCGAPSGVILTLKKGCAPKRLSGTINNINIPKKRIKPYAKI